MIAKRNLVVIGSGMVENKFLDEIISSGAIANWNVIAFCAEPRVAYARVNLSSYFSGKTAADLSSVESGLYQENGIKVHIGDRAVSIDRQ